MITQFKADPSELKAALKDLQGEEKKLATAQLDAAQQRNKGYDDWLGKLANVNQALELGGKAIGFAKDAFKAYSDDLRLRSAAGAVSLDKLKSASLGLRSEHELLTFAAQTQNGAFKLNEQQMITAQKAMVALTRAGFDQEEVTKKVTDAIVKANGGGLDDFGILLKSNGTDLENFNGLMDALAQKASGVDTNMRTTGEGVQASGVAMRESFDKMKIAIGSLVTSLSPLIEALAEAVAFAAKLVDLLPKGPSKQEVDSVQKTLAGGGDLEDAIANLKGQKAAATAAARVPQLVGARDRWGDGGGAGIDEGAFYTVTNGILAKIPGPSKPGKPRAGRFGDVATMGGTDTAGSPIGFGSTIYADALGAGMSGIDTSGIDTGAILAEKQKALTDDWQKRLATQRGKKESFLEQSFGKLEDFNAYATAFSMLTGSVSAGLNAWIDGSMSAGQAIKKFLADALKGLASQMAVEALKHGAYAIGSLAYGDLRGAGTHAAAAAAFGGAAAAAAVAAKQFGGSGAGGAYGGAGAGASGGGSGGGKAAGGGGNGSGGKDSGNARPITVIVGDYFNGDERRRRQVADEAIERALRERDG